MLKRMLKNRSRRLFLPVVIILFCALVFKSAPYIFPKRALLDTAAFSTAVYDRDMQLLRLQLADDDSYRLFAPLDNISDSLKEAVLLYEDKYFYYHFGFNIISLMRGAKSIIIKDNRALGGSTITMQLARIKYDLHTKTILGKIQQILYSIYLEFRYSKKEILEAYLNLAPYGHNIYGVAAASLIYFNERVENLALIEALTLAVIPQNPTGRRVTNDKGMVSALEARDLLYQKWVMSYPDDRKYEEIFKLRLSVSTPKDLPQIAPHFVNNLIYEQRLKGNIFSTLDYNLQMMVERHISSYTRHNKDIGLNNAAVLIINHTDMDILAYAGSANFYDDKINGQVDGVDSKRSPASSLKPFIFALAIDEGLIHPKSMMKDAPKRFGAYSPENADRGFMGPLFATEALIHSRNIPAVDLLNSLDNNSYYHMLIKAGVKNMKSPSYYGSALALGGFETTMLESVSLYLALAKFGEVGCINYLKDKRCAADDKKLFSAEAAYLTMMMLDENPKPYVYRDLGHIYWKTGTSFAYRDGWCIGILGDYILAVWVGNFDGEGNPNFNGRRGAGNLFFAIASSLKFETDSEFNNITPPKILNIQKVDICSPTGDLAGKFCPKIEKGLFIPGVSPIKVSDIHRQIAIDKKTGLRACSYDPATTVLKVYEFWPTELLTLFQKSGIQKTVPPAYLPDCDLNAISVTGVAPIILMPANNTIYNITTDRNSRDTIPFSASVDTNVSKIFWFLDNKLLAVVAPHELFYYKPEIFGKHSLTVTDDAGRSANISFAVEAESGVLN